MLFLTNYNLKEGTKNEQEQKTNEYITETQG